MKAMAANDRLVVSVGCENIKGRVIIRDSFIFRECYLTFKKHASQYFELNKIRRYMSHIPTFYL